jgi:hypothetical protein
MRPKNFKICLLGLFLTVAPKALAQDALQDIRKDVDALKSLIALQQAQQQELQGESVKLRACLKAAIGVIEDTGSQGNLTASINSRFEGLSLAFGAVQEQYESIRREYSWGPNNIHKGFDGRCNGADQFQVGQRMWYNVDYKTGGVIDRVYCRSIKIQVGPPLTPPEADTTSVVAAMKAACGLD